MINDCHLIGFCCTTMQKEPIRPILYSLTKQMEARDNYRMLVFHCFEDLYFPDTPDSIGAASVYETINYDMLDAMIMIQSNENQKELFDSIYLRCLKHNVPVISIDQYRERAFNINFGYGEAFSDIVEHLIVEHGCKKLRHVAGIRGNSFSCTRIQSFAEVLSHHNIPFSESEVIYGEFWEAPTLAAMDHFFENGEELPDAFVCANDAMAIAVCQKLTEHGYRVPENVIVTGFDGIEIEKYHSPRLTTAIRDNDELSRAIIQVCDDIIEKTRKTPYNTELSYTPVFSESCGCKKRDSGRSNRMLTEYVKNYSYVRGYEETMNKMGNIIASNPSLGNARVTLGNYAFGGTTLCVSEEFSKFSAQNFNVNEFDEFDNAEKQQGYPQKMMVLRECLNTDSLHENEIFPTSLILPNLYERFPDNHTLVVCPLHSQEYVIGYYVTYFVPLDICVDQLYTYNMMANRCLEVVRTHEHMRYLNRKLEFLFTHDHLTGIYNRYGFYRNFREDFAELAAENKDVFIVSIDLNDMKYINDNFGHHAGDEALKITASSLTGAAEERDRDIICSRFGGDEFVVAKICCGDAKEQAERYHQRFDEVLAKLNAESGNPFTVAASVGIHCSSLEHVETVDELIELADKMMYNDKARHKRRPKGE